MADTATTPDPYSTAFLAWFAELDRRRTANDANDAHQQVIAACRETGKAGVVTIQFKYAPMADGEQMKVTASVTSKLPQPEARSLIFFVDDDENLTRNDPRQLEFGIRLAEDDRKEKRA